MTTYPASEAFRHTITVDSVPAHLRCHIIGDDAHGWRWFHHPNLILHLPSMLPIPLAEAVAARVTRCAEALKAGNWESYVWQHERPYRFDAVLRLLDEFPGHMETPRGAVRFWRLAADVWTDSEIDEADDIWTGVMAVPVPHRWAMTASKDRRRLRRLSTDGALRVYRGVQAPDALEAADRAQGGWSWSLSRDVAAWFSWRWMTEGSATTPGRAKPYVAFADVPVGDVAALLTDRGEAEVLIDPAASVDLEITIEPAGPRPKHYSLRKEDEE